MFYSVYIVFIYSVLVVLLWQTVLQFHCTTSGVLHIDVAGTKYTGKQ